MASLDGLGLGRGGHECFLEGGGRLRPRTKRLTVNEKEGNARDAAPGRRLRLTARPLLASLVGHGRHGPVRIEPGLDGGGAQVRLVGVSAVCEVVTEEDLLELVLGPAAGVVRRESEEGVGLDQTFSSITGPPSRHSFTLLQPSLGKSRGEELRSEQSL